MEECLLTICCSVSVSALGFTDPLLRDLSVQTVLHRPQLLAWNKESIKVSFVHLNWSHKVWRYILDSWILKNLCYKHVLSFILPRNVVLSWVILKNKLISWIMLWIHVSPILPFAKKKIVLITRGKFSAIRE